MENSLKTMASWLLLLGIIIAVLVGLAFGANNAWETELATPVGALLALLGFIIGVLSFFAIGTITHEKVTMFLIGTLILVLLGTTAATWTKGDWWGLAPYFTNIITYLAVFAAPAAGIIAIKAIWDAGKTKEILPKIK
ncbi:MAG: hypothetical protein QXL17_06870 [Candidatus Thermoplasmatota archaeon]